MVDYDAGVWHALVPGIGPGQRYGYRATGPWDPSRGVRCVETKLLFDPYARAITGTVTFGPAVLGYAEDDPDQPSTLDSSGSVPRSVVVDPTFDWAGDTHPHRGYADTVFYELHPKGFTQLHPAVPASQQGTYAGLAHDAVIQHLLDLGITAVELLPVHHSIPESFLVAEGLTNYWGYNTIGYCAPHESYSADARAGHVGGQVAEFKTMVKRLHEAGIEVILDVVFNHTAEADHLGPTLCFRGLDNPALLPPRPRRPSPVRRHHRLRQLAQRRPPDHPAADHGLAPVLDRGDARRRLPIRSRHRPRPPGRRIRADLGVLRPRRPGSGRVPSQAHRRAVGRRPRRQLRPRAVPTPVERVERQVPRHDA